MGVKAEKLSYRELSKKLRSDLNCSEQVLNKHKIDIMEYFATVRIINIKKVGESGEVITIVAFNLYWITYFEF